MVYIHTWDIQRPRLLLHVLHGMAEHGARYARLAAELNRNGIAVWAHDHRGHGKTAPSPADLGHFGDSNGWRLVVDDAWDVSRAMMDAYPRTPIVLFAHSMGSFIGQTLIGQHGDAYAAVVLCGTNGPPDAGEGFLRAMSRVQRLALGGRHQGIWIDGLVTKTFNHRFEPRTTNFDWLSRDDTEVRKYVGDPYCGFPLTAQAWFDFLHGKQRLGTDAHLDGIPKTLPIRVIAGSHDPVGQDTKGVSRLLKLYRRKHLAVSHVFYDSARHELINEVNRSDVTKDLIAWLAPFAKPSDAERS